MKIIISWECESEDEGNYRVYLEDNDNRLTIDTTPFRNFAVNRALAAQRVFPGAEIVEE